ncbi:MAG TPA: hypothetical protein PJ993_01000 [Candidatus Saccharibacteria bacterium]|nr:hypothetical protein [Candidatus Saccharibacteria bacterium]HMT39503.1 hypothetical protein [Candidatus Saccharibacteria bacterium]
MDIIIWSIGLLILVFCFAVFFGAPYVPTRQLDIEAIFEDIKPMGVSSFVDLGSGDGKLVLHAAKLGYNATGYEINPILWVISSYRIRNYKNARIVFRNMWSADVSKADLVFCFLASKYMQKLETKLSKEMHKGSTLASYVFELPSKKKSFKHNNTFFYRF